MMKLGLIILSWLKVNVNKKWEVGYCHNATHKPTATFILDAI